VGPLSREGPRPSALAEADPRAKLAACTGVLAGALGAGAAGLALAAAVVAVGWCSARLGVRPLVRGVRPVGGLLAFTLLFHLFATPGIPLPGTRWLPVPPTVEGLVAGLGVCARLGLAVVAARLLTAVTSPRDLVDALLWVLSPLERWGLPMAEAGLSLFVALRAAPLVLSEARGLAAAVSARCPAGRPRLWLLRHGTEALTRRVLNRARWTARALASRGWAPGRIASDRRVRRRGLDAVLWGLGGSLFVMGIVW